MGVPVGLLLSTGAFVATSALIPDAAFFQWGWRIPFLLSITLVIIGIYIRFKLPESPVFEALKGKDDLSKNPAIELVRDHQRPLLLTGGMKLFQNALFYIVTAWVLSYIVNNLQMPRSVGLNAILLASALGMISLPLFGYLSDRIGRKPVYAFGAIFGTAFVFPYFWMLDTHSVWMVTLATLIALNIANDAMFGPQAVYFSELFGTKVRLSGANTGYAIGAVLSGGLAPMIAAALVVANDGKVWGVGLCLIALGVVSTICALMARETYEDVLK
jgi:MFS transporter, MHS family, shikimate and dehydroshikimate transport protein